MRWRIENEKAPPSVRSRYCSMFCVPPSPIALEVGSHVRKAMYTSRGSPWLWGGALQDWCKQLDDWGFSSAVTVSSPRFDRPPPPPRRISPPPSVQLGFVPSILMLSQD